MTQKLCAVVCSKLSFPADHSGSWHQVHQSPNACGYWAGSVAPCESANLQRLKPWHTRYSKQQCPKRVDSTQYPQPGRYSEQQLIGYLAYDPLHSPPAHRTPYTVTLAYLLHHMEDLRAHQILYTVLMPKQIEIKHGGPLAHLIFHTPSTYPSIPDTPAPHSDHTWLPGIPRSHHSLSMALKPAKECPAAG